MGIRASSPAVVSNVIVRDRVGTAQSLDFNMHDFYAPPPLCGNMGHWYHQRLQVQLTMKPDMILSGPSTASVCIDVHIYCDTKGHMDAYDLGQAMLVSENCDTMWHCRPGLPALPHWAMVLSRPVLLPRAMSGFLSQQPPDSGLMNMAPIAIQMPRVCLDLRPAT